MNEKTQTQRIVIAALLAALIVLCTVFIRIPTFSGYIHIGTVIVFLSVVLLGAKYGTLIGAVGTALADLISGYALWAPGSFAVVFLSVGVYAFCISRTIKKYGVLPESPKPLELLGVILSGVIMVFGYYVYGALVFYGWAGALVEVLGNTAQFVAGVLIARIAGTAMCRGGIRKYYEYPYVHSNPKNK